jgi:hypothetical protein
LHQLPNNNDNIIMKVTAVAPLVVIGLSGANAKLDAIASKTPSLADFRDYNRRGLQLSEECIANTEALYKTTEIAAANAAWVEELATMEGECSAKDGTGKCVLDSKNLEAHDQFVEACANAGGTLALISDSFKCDITDGDKSGVAHFEFVDVPECIAPGCEAVVGRAIVAGFVSNTADLTEQALAKEFDSVECTSADEAPPATSLAHGVSPKAVFGIMSLALSFFVL